MRISSSALALAAALLPAVCSASSGGDHQPRRGKGICAQRGTCGRKNMFSPELPCPDDGDAEEPDSDFRSQLVSVCGAEYASGPTCCTPEAVSTLSDNLAQVEPLLSSCPACRNNFRSFFCAFTCSPDQSTFVTVAETQPTDDGAQIAVKRVEFSVSPSFGIGFFDSCKNVQFGATNGYVMDLIGGGAKNYSSFFKFLGDERPGLGSPFQIDFPIPSPPAKGITPLDLTPRKCSDPDLASRCTCLDCPEVCTVLPSPPPLPGTGPTCHVGAASCLTFVLLLAYALALLAFFTGYSLQRSFRKRRERSFFERVALSGDSGYYHGATSSAATLDDSSGGHDVDSGHLRGASLLDPLEVLQPKRYWLNTALQRAFYRLGLICARYPFLVLAATCAFVGLANLGWRRFEVETNPVRLWVAPDSETKLQKEYFDEHFGPFYRTQQIFLTSASTSHPAVLDYDTLEWWFSVEEEIRALESPSGLTLADVCFAPSAASSTSAPPVEACIVQSVAGYFGNDLSGYDRSTWRDHLDGCASQPGSCLPPFGQPLKREIVLGGIPDDGRPSDACAAVVTYVVANSQNKTVVSRAQEWERTLEGYLLQLQRRAQERGLRITFSTEVSLEEELNKSTNTDIRIVVLSYLAMFLYVGLTLGSSAPRPSPLASPFSSIRALGRSAGSNIAAVFSRRSGDAEGRTALPTAHANGDARLPSTLLPRRLVIDSKFSLGLFGIIIVLVSVSTSVALFSAVGVKVTLIIAEVIPFLVLAVGVDNVFILVNELEKQNALHGPTPADGPAPSSSSDPRSSYDSGEHDAAHAATLSVDERVARALARMGPSILLSGTTEVVAFALGALVPMPAVRNFALYAALSVLVDALLQVTVFVSAMTLDQRRVESNRVDCLPCLSVSAPIRLHDPTATAVGEPGSDSLITAFFRRYYAPFILRKEIKTAVLALFGALFVGSVIAMQRIELGLDQRLALPSSSYLVDYFNDLDTYLDVGPPVYFVERGVNVSSRGGQRSLCGRFTTCDPLSVANILEAERKRPESSYISESTASWIDDFLHWLDPAIETCCRVRKSDPSVFCSPRDSERMCKPCFEGREPAFNITMDGLPEGPETIRYLRQWLDSPTDENCPLGGRASFRSAVSLDESASEVTTSHFRTFHAPLKSQADFINALAAAERISADLSREIGAEVFPYSLFYVFFAQYATIVSMTQQILGLALLAIFAVTSVLLGSWRTGLIVTVTVALTVVTQLGVMGLWAISLNAISLVNLVVSLGIAVEFCSHIARAFMSAGASVPPDSALGQKERDERVWTALVDVGPSVVSGITLTKLIGISVLGLTRSKLLRVYYFRMWLSLIIAGALHGFVFLPVVLSLYGGMSNFADDVDEDALLYNIRGHNRPFTNDSDDDDSDAG